MKKVFQMELRKSVSPTGGQGGTVQQMGNISRKPALFPLRKGRVRGILGIGVKVRRFAALDRYEEVFPMTELEKIKYAKQAVEKLANGINPFTGQGVPNDDTLNQVKVSRCLFYVADILRQVAENGGVGKKGKKSAKQPFSLSPDFLRYFQFSSTPISLTEFLERLNSLIDKDNTKKLSFNTLSGWLIEMGFLKMVVAADGRNTRRPTTAGNALGIHTESRMGQQGSYTVVVHTKEAQQFILDNLDAVVAYMK